MLAMPRYDSFSLVRSPVIHLTHSCAPDYDLCRACLSNPFIMERHNISHKFWPITEAGDYDSFVMARDRLSDKSGVFHEAVYCDGCDGTIHGARHKCLDCEGTNPLLFYPLDNEPTSSEPDD